jgi:hypothetical protein
LKAPPPTEGRVSFPDGAIIAALPGRLLPAVDRESVGSPMRRERRDRRLLLRTQPDDLAAVSAILRRQHQLLLWSIEVAFRLAVVGALDDAQQLFRRKIWTFLRAIELRPVLRNLVAPVHGHLERAGRVERKAFAVRMPVA